MTAFCPLMTEKSSSQMKMFVFVYSTIRYAEVNNFLLHITVKIKDISSHKLAKFYISLSDTQVLQALLLNLTVTVPKS